MQVNVKNVEYLAQSTQVLNSFIESIEAVANNNIRKIKYALGQSVKELSNSNNLLTSASVNETQKQTALLRKEAELSLAIQEEAAVVSSGNPYAIAAASAYVARKTNEVYIANQKYQRAVKNRFNMEKRVELVNKAKTLNERLLEKTQNIFNVKITKINNIITRVNNRLQRAYKELNHYFNYNSLDSTELDELESIISSNEK